MSDKGSSVRKWHSRAGKETLGCSVRMRGKGKREQCRRNEGQAIPGNKPPFFLFCSYTEGVFEKTLAFIRPSVPRVCCQSGACCHISVIRSILMIHLRTMR